MTRVKYAGYYYSFPKGSHPELLIDGGRNVVSLNEWSKAPSNKKMILV